MDCASRFKAPRLHATPNYDLQVSQGHARISMCAAVWDTHGQERFNSLPRVFYRAARVALVVYDIADRASFDHVGRWVGSILANTTGAGKEEQLVMTLGTCDVCSVALVCC